jgi:tetratricopeptide (TPR) repeat protein
MRKILLAFMIYGCTSLFAATPSDFYVDLLRRGVAEVDAGRPANAPALLRIAAFGLVDSIEHYEIAQVYLAIASDRLGEPDSARQAAQRVVAAERVERRYGSLAIAAPIRAAFDSLVRRTLPASDAAMLNAPAAVSPPAAVPVIPPAASTTNARPATPAPTPAKANPPKPNPAPVERRPVPETQPAARPAVQKPAVSSPQASTVPANPGTSTATTAAPAKPAPTPAKPAAQPAKPAVDVNAQLAAADRALGSVNLVEARRVFREVLKVQGLGRAELIRAGEGLYRARDFGGALEAFRRLGALRRGEEPYRYYVAVALYETGDYAAAKRELTAALPYIELTPDVLRYRSRIEGAR